MELRGGIFFGEELRVGAGWSHTCSFGEHEVGSDQSSDPSSFLRELLLEEGAPREDYLR